MPKIIEGIREKAVAKTRQVLQSQGYEALAMREIAAHCGVAVGTMYNYFPSKVFLTACVVLEDWQEAYQAMREAAEHAREMETAIARIYENMCLFVREHQYLTAFDLRKLSGEQSYAKYHGILCRQIEELLEVLQIKAGFRLQPEITLFLAESIINCSVRNYAYAQIAPAFHQLVKE